MNSEQPKRFYEAKFGAETEFAILPGENPVEFELLHTRLAEEWVPDGPLEDDAVYTMAKCIWRKRRYQRFNAARNTAAKFDPDHEAYDEQASLTVFRHLLLQQTNDEGVIQLLSRLGGHLADYLRDKSPRRNFKTVKAWIKAMRHETLKLLSQGIRFGPLPAEAMITQSAAFLTDEAFARELEFEKRLEAELKEACNRLFEIRAAKRRIQFREIQRFERRHPTRLIGIIR